MSTGRSGATWGIAVSPAAETVGACAPSTPCGTSWRPTTDSAPVLTVSVATYGARDSNRRASSMCAIRAGVGCPQWGPTPGTPVGSRVRVVRVATSTKETSPSACHTTAERPPSIRRTSRGRSWIGIHATAPGRRRSSTVRLSDRSLAVTANVVVGSTATAVGPSPSRPGPVGACAISASPPPCPSNSTTSSSWYGMIAARRASVGRAAIVRGVRPRRTAPVGVAEATS